MVTEKEIKEEIRFVKNNMIDLIPIAKNMKSKEQEIKEEIEKKFKPKILRIDELKKDKIILTDTYSWRDFKEAIELTYQTAKQEFIERVNEFNDRILKGDFTPEQLLFIQNLIERELKKSLGGKE